MESIDSQDSSSGKSRVGILCIFSVLFIVIGLVLDDTMASSDTLGPTGGQLFGLLILFTGGVMFLITGFIISLRVVKFFVEDDFPNF
tara:strand:- start:1253 stop:1513 length:261 start_codon:yes stop_codon:yes gene_type:complete